MRPFDDVPYPDDDYSDVALLVAGAREWPREEFSRELDARVARRFEPERGAETDGSRRRGRPPRWAAGPAVALVAGAVAAVVVISGGGLGGSPRDVNGAAERHAPLHASDATQTFSSPTTTGLALHGLPNRTLGTETGALTSNAPAAAAPGTAAPTAGSGQSAVNGSSAYVPTAPGPKQIQAAQISLTTPNQHVGQVSDEVFSVVSQEGGTVQSSHITAAMSSSGGGYASFSLRIPTGHLQDAMTRLSSLRYAAVSSRTDSSQNVSNQYAGDQRQLSDARALRTSLLKQLQTAYTQSAIDSIRAQLKLAEQQISSWQTTLTTLRRRISYSNVTVQVNAGGLPVSPQRGSGGFTIGRAGHDALRVLVVSAGAALIALAVLVPVGMVAALLMWLWVWLRQRRRERALDAAA